MKSLVMVELNEINFDLIKKYINAAPRKYRGWEKLLSFHNITTVAEVQYEEQEPWIQWVSVHTGLEFSEHKVFRLGDIVGSNVVQIFELLESRGKKIGAISPFNAENRLVNPKYFIPDPWTNTQSDNSWLSKGISKAVKQAVNDNAQSKISFRNIFWIICGILWCLKLDTFAIYKELLLKSLRKKWCKALFLDLLLHELHLKLLRSSGAVDFSTIFLNAGAHIQHHYLLNSKHMDKKGDYCCNPEWYLNQDVDPLLDMIGVYDHILRDYCFDKDLEIILCTGLSQVPYDRVKYYYRLKEHSNFLSKLGINFLNVQPRMTRDFLVTFKSEKDAMTAAEVLSAIAIEQSGEKLFGLIDPKGAELFVTLTYSREIFDDDRLIWKGMRIPISRDVCFVAIKNGMHQSKGFAYFTKGVEKFAPACGDHVKQIHKSICDYFAISDNLKNVTN